MKIRRLFGAVTVAAIATLTGFGAAGASAADTPAAPTLDKTTVVSPEVPTVSGSCPTSTANPLESIDILVDGLVYWQEADFDKGGKYSSFIDETDPGEHTVSVTCHRYLGDQDSPKTKFTVLPAIVSSIQIVDNNGGNLSTGDAVSMVATQTFNTEQTDYSFYVQSTADVQLSDDEPRVKFAKSDGTFFELPVTLTKTSNDYGVRWEVAISGTIPAGTILTVEANGTLTAEEGSTITITDGRTGETEEVTVGEAAEVTMVVTPTEGAAGINVQIDATGLQADTTYEVFFHSLPVKVGEVTSDADGAVHTSITVPADAALGAHTIALVLNGEVVVSAPFHVVTDTQAPTTAPTTAPTQAPAPPAPPAGTPGGGLANTGFEAGPLSGAAAGFILIGGGLIFAARRKPAARQH